ncbi:hypothetical protein [Streptomyces sp. NRRL S-455]|uniref:hypothetical protein n=1 Tax=Streptomyces sp. NRRL S-455 TaxID=1463908 RepID=UPI0004C08505|nr:hypothetical protein [Streptomyces sp. NRRL S-455]
MTDMNPRPLLAHAHEEADAYLMRKAMEGSMTPGVAKDMATTGFTAVTRTLSYLRTRDGLSEQAIVDSFQRQLGKAREAGDEQRVIAAEFTLAVWDGMQRDLAEYLRDAGAEAQR